MGKKLGQADDPLLVSVRSGAQVLDARHDGHRPQHRPLRRLRRGPRQAVRRRAVRLGLLPPPHPDVRQDRARRRRRPLRGGAGRGQGGQGHRRRPRPRRAPTCSTLVDTFKEIVRDEAGRDFPQDPREQMDLAIRAVFDSWNARPGRALPPPGAHPGRPRHRGQRLLDGLRQPRPRLRHRRRLHPRPGSAASRASTATTCRTPRARTSSRASATPSRSPTSSSIDKKSYDQLHADHGDAGEPLQGPLRHRVHHRARPAVDAADPGRQAHRRRRLPHRHPARRPGPDRRGRGAAARHRRPARAADVPALRRRTATAKQLGRGIAASPGRGRRQGGLRLLHRGQVVPLRREGHPRSAARPTPTTSTA